MKGKAMIRTTTLLLAGTLLTTAGCQRVYGDRSFHGNNVYGPGYEFPRAQVYGDTSFRNRVNGPTDAPFGAPEPAPPTSDRVITSTRTETVTTPPLDTPRDEVAHSERANDVDHAAPTPAPTPAPVVVTPPRPEPVDRPVTSPPVERPAVADKDIKPTPAADANASVAPSTPNGRDPERVARASNARYPDDLKPSDDLRAAATIDRANRTVRIQNYTANELRGGDLWVNETYVSPIPTIASGASAAVPLNQFYDRDGRPLPALTESSKLQLQTAGKLYNISLQPEDLNK